MTKKNGAPNTFSQRRRKEKSTLVRRWSVYRRAAPAAPQVELLVALASEGLPGHEMNPQGLPRGYTAERFAKRVQHLRKDLIDAGEADPFVGDNLGEADFVTRIDLLRRELVASGVITTDREVLRHFFATDPFVEKLRSEAPFLDDVDVQELVLRVRRTRSLSCENPEAVAFETLYEGAWNIVKEEFQEDIETRVDLALALVLSAIMGPKNIRAMSDEQLHILTNATRNAFCPWLHENREKHLTPDEATELLSWRIKLSPALMALREADERARMS